MSKQQMPQNRAFLQLSTGKCSFELMQQHYHFGPHWLSCSGPCGPPIGPLSVTDPRTCYWYIIKCKNHPKNHPIKETKPEKGIWYSFQPKTILGNQGSLQQPLCGPELAFLFFWPLYISLVYHTIWIWSQKPQTMSTEAYEKGILHSFPPENDIRSSFVAHATTPIGPQSDPSGLLTLVHVKVILTIVDMTLKTLFKRDKSLWKSHLPSFSLKIAFWAVLGPSNSSCVPLRIFLALVPVSG